MKYREFNKMLITLAFSLCLYQVAFGQDKTIELPQTEGFEFKSKGKHVNPYFRIYINKKKEVYFEKIKLDSMIQLVDTINKYKSQLGPVEFVFTNFFLYADRNLPYSSIDSVKSILGSLHIAKFFYLTNSLENMNSGLANIIRASLVYRKVLNPGYDKPREISREHPKGSGVKKSPMQIMVDKLYEQKFEEVKKLLFKFKYRYVKFINDKYIMLDDVKVALSNEEAIYNHLKDLDFYFLYNSPTMSYGDCVKNWTVIINIFKKYKFSVPSTEISNGLERILVREKIKL
jgi:biopolymer transport protein ExbD